jgi:hypothetical protein
MITIFGVKVSYEVAAFFILFIASEYLGLNKRYRSNTVSQVIIKAARYFAPFRKEDDRIRKIVDSFRK